MVNACGVGLLGTRQEACSTETFSCCELAHFILQVHPGVMLFPTSWAMPVTLFYLLVLQVVIWNRFFNNFFNCRISIWTHQIALQYIYSGNIIQLVHFFLHFFYITHTFSGTWEFLWKLWFRFYWDRSYAHTKSIHADLQSSTDWNQERGQ